MVKFVSARPSCDGSRLWVEAIIPEEASLFVLLLVRFGADSAEVELIGAIPSAHEMVNLVEDWIPRPKLTCGYAVDGTLNKPQLDRKLRQIISSIRR